MSKQLFIICIALSIPLTSMGQEFCKNILNQAKKAFARKEFSVAQDKLNDTGICDLENKLLEERQEWQQKIFDAIQQQKKEAEDARDETKASALAAQAREMALTDPTVALNLAVAAYNTSPIKQSAEALAAVLSNPYSVFYTSRKKVSIDKAFIDPLEEVEDFEKSKFFVSPDGANLVVTNKKEIRLIDLKSNSLPFLLDDDYDPGEKVVFSPDASTLMIHGNGACRIWDLREGNQNRLPLKDWKKVREAAYSPNGSKIVLTTDEKIEIWDPLFQDSVVFIPAGLKAGDLSLPMVSDDGKTVLAFDKNKDSLYVWKVSEADSLFLERTHYLYNIQSAALAPGGGKAVIVMTDGTAKILELETGNTQELGPIINEFTPLESKLAEDPENAEATSTVISARFSPDGTRVITVARNEFLSPSVKIWDATSAREVYALNGLHGVVYSAGFTPDGNQILTTSGTFSIDVGREETYLEPELIFWDMLTPNSSVEVEDVKKGKLKDLAFLPGGKDFAAFYTNEMPGIWDLQSGEMLRSVSGDEKIIHNEETQTVLVDNVLWFVNPDGAMECEKLPAELDDDQGESALSPNGRKVVDLDNSYNRSDLIVFDLASSISSLPVKDAHNDWINKVFILSDNQRFVTAAEDGWIKFWDLETGARLDSIAAHSENGKETTIDISPDEEWLASASYDGTVKLWKLNGSRTVPEKTWSQVDNVVQPLLGLPAFQYAEGIDTFMKQELPVKMTSVQFSGDGSRLFIASDGGTDEESFFISVWEIKTKTLLYILSWDSNQMDGVKRIYTSPDGTRVIASDLNDTMIWSDPIEKLKTGQYYQLTEEDKKKLGVSY